MADPMWRTYWPEFERIMKKRLDTGYREYGDGSFSKDPKELLEEVAQETLDIVGWGFILWTRLQVMKTALSGAGETADTLG